MGLDIYFKRVNKIDFQFAKKKDTQEAYDELNIEDIGYFRKVNCLLPFFGYEDDCSIHPIEKCQIQDLVNTAKELLAVYDTISYQLHLQQIDLNYYKEIYKDNKKMCNERCKPVLAKMEEIRKSFESVAQEMLPTTTGFFFGSQAYREYYVADLKDIVEIFTKVLDETDFDIDQIFMYCWW
jgi:ATP-dependent Lon protease